VGDEHRWIPELGNIHSKAPAAHGPHRRARDPVRGRSPNSRSGSWRKTPLVPAAVCQNRGSPDPRWIKTPPAWPARSLPPAMRRAIERISRALRA
jgi:hypothetical protein